MAVNETIVTGRKFRKLIDETNKLWQKISFWGKASDVEFDDGNDAETKIGAINGVTDSLTSTSSNIAASAAAVKALNDKITELSNNISKNNITDVLVVDVQVNGYIVDRRAGGAYTSFTVTLSLRGDSYVISNPSKEFYCWDDSTIQATFDESFTATISNKDNAEDTVVVDVRAAGWVTDHTNNTASTTFTVTLSPRDDSYTISSPSKEFKQSSTVEKDTYYNENFTAVIFK